MHLVTRNMGAAHKIPIENRFESKFFRSAFFSLSRGQISLIFTQNYPIYRLRDNSHLICLFLTFACMKRPFCPLERCPLKPLMTVFSYLAGALERLFKSSLI